MGAMSERFLPADGPAAPVETSTSFVGSPRRLYRLLAFAEMVTWTLLIAGMVMKYALEWTELGVRIGGMIHGFVFLAYCVVTVLVGVDARWGIGRILLGLGSAVIPYLTVPFERWMERSGRLPRHWRLQQEEPQGPVESLGALYLRRPLLMALVTLVVLVAVFSGLRWAGPPTRWFA